MPDEDKVQVQLRGSEGNPQLATVDDITLEKGGEPKLLTGDQLERLKKTGVTLSTEEPDERTAAQRLEEDNSLEQLKQEAAARALPASGTKEELARRIAEHDNDDDEEVTS